MNIILSNHNKDLNINIINQTEDIPSADHSKDRYKTFGIRSRYPV